MTDLLEVLLLSLELLELLMLELDKQLLESEESLLRRRLWHLFLCSS